MQYLLIFLVGFLQVTSCTSSEENKSKKRESLAKDGWTVLLSGQQCGIEVAKNALIKSQADFDKLWNEFKTDNPDQPAKPEVDFQSKWVIGSFLGTVSSAGHSIEIKSVMNETNETVIYLLHRRPGPDCLTAQVIESPYLLVSIDQFKPDTVKFRIDNLDEKCE